MYLIVFVGLAWLLTAPAMALLIGKVATTGQRRTRRRARSVPFAVVPHRGRHRPA